MSCSEPLFSVAPGRRSRPFRLAPELWHSSYRGAVFEGETAQLGKRLKNPSPTLQNHPSPLQLLLDLKIYIGSCLILSQTPGPSSSVLSTMTESHFPRTTFPVLLGDDSD